MTPLEKENRRKYLKSPTFEQIEEFINELDVSYAQFERFFGMKTKTINRVKIGERGLPAKYWHIIYERIKPAYGVGFASDYVSPKKSRNKSSNIFKESLSGYKKRDHIDLSKRISR
jgi:hypothetical protein